MAGARAALAAVREPWEPESTAYNLSLIREARAARGETVDWADELERELLTRPRNGAEGRGRMDAEQRAEAIIAGGDDADVAERRQVAERAAPTGPRRPDRADADRGRAAGRCTTGGSPANRVALARGCCATTSSSATRAGCSAGFEPRETTASSCASSTRSARTRTWSSRRPAGWTARSRS